MRALSKGNTKAVTATAKQLIYLLRDEVAYDDDEGEKKEEEEESGGDEAAPFPTVEGFSRFGDNEVHLVRRRGFAATLFRPRADGAGS